MRNLSLAVALLAPLLCCAVMQAQTSDKDQIELLRHHLMEQRRMLMDWGGLLHYGSDDTEVQPPLAGENRVVFLGDQVTESWGEGDAPFFPHRPYLNRGISGQTTSQFLVRFRQDVIELQPKVVIIQGGANDIAGVGGPATSEMISENLMSMADLAQVHGIKVVLTSLLPVCDCFGKSALPQRLQGRISELNHEIKDYAQKSGFPYIDYYSALVETGARDMRKQLTADGTLPNGAGYALMAPLAEEAIAQALRKQ